jgi:hypothetical protein
MLYRVKIIRKNYAFEMLIEAESKGQIIREISSAAQKVDGTTKIVSIQEEGTSLPST